MSHHLKIVLLMLIVAELACNLPGFGGVPVPLPQSRDETLAFLISISVSPASGSGIFTGTAVYKPGAKADTLECQYALRDSGQEFGRLSTPIPADATLNFQETLSSFQFTVTQPGDYRLTCWPGSSDSDSDNRTVDFTVTTLLAWEQVGVGDCTGKDVGSTEGSTPDSNWAREGHTAVCWDGSTYNNAGSPGKAFCTYKSITPDQCVGGSNIGVMYRAIDK